jgi:hypothetical protein
MRKILTVLTAATAMTLGAAMAVPQPAEARGGRWAGAVLGGLAAGAIIGGLAAQGGYYGYGPGYYGYAPGYGYGPGYYGPPPYAYAPPVYVVPHSGYYGGPRSGSTGYSHGGYNYGPVGGECFPCY